jgi:hypothetical protein
VALADCDPDRDSMRISAVSAKQPHGLWNRDKVACRHHWRLGRRTLRRPLVAKSEVRMTVAGLRAATAKVNLTVKDF